MGQPGGRFSWLTVEVGDVKISHILKNFKDFKKLGRGSCRIESLLRRIAGKNVIEKGCFKMPKTAREKSKSGI